MHYPKNLDKTLAGVIAKLPAKISPVMLFATAIAAPPAIWIIFISLTTYSLATDNDYLLRAVIIGVVLTPIAEISKYITKRRRPETLYAKRMRFKTYSFPSGHSYIAMLVFGFLAVLAFSALSYGFILSGVLAALIFMVGVSRVFLGAHFPSDVLAGWTLGGIILTIWVKIGL